MLIPDSDAVCRWRRRPIVGTPDPTVAPWAAGWVIVGGVRDNGTHHYGDFQPSPGMAICRWRGGKWRDQWDDFYGPEDPAWWMPLPA